MRRNLQRTLLRIPLIYKILTANSAIVALGAVAGTVITVWHVLRYPNDVHYELIALFAGAGIVASFLVNSWVLRRALAPLDRLQDAVDEVRRGHTAVRVEPGTISDERFDRLAETFPSAAAPTCASTCVAVCPTGALYKEEELTRLNRDLCSGCTYCVDACPFGVPKRSMDAPVNVTAAPKSCAQAANPGRSRPVPIGRLRMENASRFWPKR